MMQAKHVAVAQTVGGPVSYGMTQNSQAQRYHANQGNQGGEV
jgi:hypothetical protein